MLSTEDLSKQGLNACAFPFDRLSRKDDLERGDEVVPVGNPNGMSWILPMEENKIFEIDENQIVFQSTYIRGGHSGGALIDNSANLVGMITADSPPFGRAMNINAVLQQIKQWGYPVMWSTADFRENRRDIELHQAAKKGDIVTMKKLLALCHNPNEADYQYRTPLHYAAMEGKVEAISLLLKAGAFVDVQDFNEYYPLHLAVSEGHLESVKLLIKAGTKINNKIDEGFTPLHLALDSNINQEIAIFLIQAGANVNAQNDYKSTPLHFAVYIKSIDIAKSLVKAGASLEVQDEYFNTPLMTAVSEENLEMIRLLVASGARVNAQKTSTATGALHMAALYSNNIEVIKLLLKNGADVNAKNESGDTPLHYAVIRRNDLDKLLEVMTVLLKAGAKVNAVNEEAMTVLSKAKMAQENSSKNKDELINRIKAIESLLLQYGGK